MLMNSFQPNWIQSPGKVIENFINISKLDLDSIDRAELSLLEDIKKDKQKIDSKVITLLTKLFGGSETFWFGLQNEYDQNVVRLQSKKIDPNFKNFRNIVNQLKAEQYLPSVEFAYLDQVNLKSFYGLSEYQPLEIKTIVSNVLGSKLKAIGSYSVSDINLATYIKKVEFEANKQFKINNFIWNKEKLLAKIDELKTLTKNRKVLSILPDLTELLNQCGVALVVAKTLPNTPICGLAKFLEDGKAVVAITPKYNKDYIFWQTLFHELGHLILHQNEMIFCDESDNNQKSDLEIEADNFMIEKLLDPIAPAELKSYINLNLVKRDKEKGWREINEKARELNISASLLTGILKKMELIPYNYYTNGHRNIFD